MTEGHETYRWSLSANSSDAVCADGVLTCTKRFSAWNEWDRAAAVFSVNSAGGDSVEARRAQNILGWHEYFARVASVDGISDEEKYLYK